MSKKTREQKALEKAIAILRMGGFLVLTHTGNGLEHHVIGKNKTTYPVDDQLANRIKSHILVHPSKDGLFGTCQTWTI